MIAEVFYAGENSGNFSWIWLWVPHKLFTLDLSILKMILTVILFASRWEMGFNDDPLLIAGRPRWHLLVKQFISWQLWKYWHAIRCTAVNQAWHWMFIIMILQKQESRRTYDILWFLVSSASAYIRSIFLSQFTP